MKFPFKTTTSNISSFLLIHLASPLVDPKRNIRPCETIIHVFKLARE